MALLRVPLGTGKEPEVATEGEYDLTVRRFIAKLSKAGKAMYEVTFAFTGEPDLKSFRQYFMLPDSDDDQSRRVDRVREIRRFVNTFGVEFDDDGVLPFGDDDENDGLPEAFEIEDVLGRTGKTFVTVEHDDQYGDSNRARFRRVK